MPPYSDQRQLAEAVARGEVVIVVDHPDRENEGDFVLAAGKASVARLAFMVNESRGGILCLAVAGSRLDELDIPLMCTENTERNQTPFTVSVDARHGTHTGVSLSDRLRTVQAILDPGTRPEDLARPGHLFPIRAADGGVLERAGHTEAAVDLCRLADLYPAALICEILNPDGTMARGPELHQLAARHGLLMCTVDDIVLARREVGATELAGS
ncbi:MAG: 3,4-dihydroxy-2-butanone-4-phosphate synthase [Armatimonadota bacterium]